MTIKLKIKGLDVELSPAEARALHGQLATIFAEAPKEAEAPPAPVIVPYPVIYYPHAAPPQPINPQQPWFDPWIQPTITCGGGEPPQNLSGMQARFGSASCERN